MAVSFAAGGFALANWGFSVGDVAVLAGAGRNIGTWLNTHLKDRTLFEWMGTDVDTVFTRRGLLDVERLQQRWDQKIVLLKNGERQSFKTNSSGTDLRRMDRWTWLMVLYTAALDTAVSLTDMRQIMTRVLMRSFEDREEESEFIDREGPSHLEGWRSASCVRTISLRARDVWAGLSRQGKHPPGYIPSSENGAIVQFLMWLMNGDGVKECKCFRTSSADIFSLAIVLEDIGVLIKTTENPHETFDEAETVVYWSSTVTYPMAYDKAQAKRRTGMRIPLEHIEEVGSVFPDDRNQIRNIMREAMKAVQDDQLQLTPRLPADALPYVKGSPFQQDEQDIIYTFTHRQSIPVPRLEHDDLRFANWLLVQPGPAVCNALVKVIKRLSESDEERHNLQMIALTLDNQEHPSDRIHDLKSSFDYGEAITHIQAFLLGYWYALLSPLVDSAQLPTREAYGAWAWSDIECVDFIRQCLSSRHHQKLSNGRKSFSLYRYEILKLVSYLFGGADINIASSAKFGALGVLGKLPVLYTSLLGGSVERLGKFALLDVDASCIPSSTSGIVLPGRPKPLIRMDTNESMATNAVAELDWRHLGRSADKCDFTIHIEPDWDYDAQTCLVAYRYRGRVIHHLNPRQIDVVLARQQSVQVSEDDENRSSTSENDPQYHIPEEYCPTPLTAFYGNVTLHSVETMANVNIEPPGFVFKPVLVNTLGLPNALVCLMCMYQGWKDTGHTRLKIVRDRDDFDEAIRAFATIILCDRGGWNRCQP